MKEKSSDPFAAALAELLGPLAQGIVACGLTIGAATESMKRALLEAAIEATGPSVSDSRISVMTGLHRKDVRRLRESSGPDSDHRNLNRSAMLIGYWATAPEYQGTDGQPRNLPRQATAEGPGFDDLVRQTRLDLAPGTILKALIDQGAVAEITPDHFKLLTNSLVPAVGSAELVGAYRATLSTHLSAATQNLLAKNEGPRNFDRVVKYSHLSDASITALEIMAQQGAQRLLEDINARAMELQRQDGDTNAKGSFAAGAYILPVRASKEQGKK